MDIKCSVFIAASVDGFIAREDGDIEWLHSPEYDCPSDKTVYAGGDKHRAFDIHNLQLLFLGRCI